MHVDSGKPSQRQPHAPPFSLGSTPLCSPDQIKVSYTYCELVIWFNLHRSNNGCIYKEGKHIPTPFVNPVRGSSWRSCQSQLYLPSEEKRGCTPRRLGTQMDGVTANLSPLPPSCSLIYTYSEVMFTSRHRSTRLRVVRFGVVFNLPQLLTKATHITSTLGKGLPLRCSQY